MDGREEKNMNEWMNEWGEGLMRLMHCGTTKMWTETEKRSKFRMKDNKMF